MSISVSDSIHDAPQLLVDCQTTGFGRNASQLLEIAWKVLPDQSMFSTVVRVPDDVKIPRRVLAMTGIDADEVAAGSDPGTIRERLDDLLTKHSSMRFIAHFARVEIEQLERVWNGTEQEDAVSPHSRSLPFVCLHRVARRALPELGSYGLRALVGYFGGELGELRRADAHVAATEIVWRGLRDHLLGLGIKTFTELDGWLAQPSEKVKRSSERGRKRTGFHIGDDVRLGLPDRPGVYRFCDKSGKVLYVGKATSLHHRVNSYFRGKKGQGARKREMLLQAWSLDVTETGTPLGAALLEYDEIIRLSPPYNVMLREMAGLASRELSFGDRTMTNWSSAFAVQNSSGPLFSTRGVGELCGISRFLATGDIKSVRDLFRDLEDEGVLREGIALVSQGGLLDETTLRNPRALVVLGVRQIAALGPQFVELIRERIESETDEDESADEEDLKSDTSAEKEQLWTPERVAARLARLPMSMARRWFRSRWFARLSEAEIVFVDPRTPESHWILSVTGGRVVRRERYAVGMCADVPAQWQRPAYDRWSSLSAKSIQHLGILVQELRRILVTGGSVEICLGPRMRLRGDDLVDLWLMGFGPLPRLNLELGGPHG